METKNCLGGCLLSLIGGWFALWVLVHIIDLCRRLPLLKDIADGFLFTLGFIVYVMVLASSCVIEGVKMVFQ